MSQIVEEPVGFVTLDEVGPDEEEELGHQPEQAPPVDEGPGQVELGGEGPTPVDDRAAVPEAEPENAPDPCASALEAVSARVAERRDAERREQHHPSTPSTSGHRDRLRMICPVKSCRAKESRSMRVHVCLNHLPQAFYEDATNVEDTRRIFAARRRYWEQLYKEVFLKQGLSTFVRAVVKSIDNQKLGTYVATVPPQLQVMLNLVAADEGRPLRYSPYITELGDQAMYAWRVAAHGLNFLSRKKQVAFIEKIGGPGVRPSSAPE